MSGEFAAEFPKIAGRLGLDGFECADPYVERLIEGFAFLAARVRLKVDAEFPRFTRHMLQDRKSTRLNSSHPSRPYAVFCLKKKILQTCFRNTSHVMARLALVCFGNSHTQPEMLQSIPQGFDLNRSAILFCVSYDITVNNGV